MYHSKYAHIGDAGTFRSSASPARLHSVVVNDAGTLTLYEGTSTSGTKIAELVAESGPGTFVYDVELPGGLYAAATGNGDWTLILD